MSDQFPGGKYRRITLSGPKGRTDLAKSDSKAEFAKSSTSFSRSGSVAYGLSGSWTFNLNTSPLHVLIVSLLRTQRLLVCSLQVYQATREEVFPPSSSRFSPRLIPRRKPLSNLENAKILKYLKRAYTGRSCCCLHMFPCICLQLSGHIFSGLLPGSSSWFGPISTIPRQGACKRLHGKS